MENEENYIQLNRNLQKKNKYNKKNNLYLLYKRILIRITKKLFSILCIIYIFYFLFQNKVEIPKFRKLNQNY